MKRIKDTPEDYRLRILAEECAELSQASLKLIRAKDNDTPISTPNARMLLIEECADVIVGIRSVLSDVQLDGMKAIATQKEARWEQRLNANAEVL